MEIGIYFNSDQKIPRSIEPLMITLVAHLFASKLGGKNYLGYDKSYSIPQKTGEEFA